MGKSLSETCHLVFVSVLGFSTSTWDTVCFMCRQIRTHVNDTHTCRVLHTLLHSVTHTFSLSGTHTHTHSHTHTHILTLTHKRTHARTPAPCSPQCPSCLGGSCRASFPGGAHCLTKRLPPLGKPLEAGLCQSLQPSFSQPLTRGLSHSHSVSHLCPDAQRLLAFKHRAILLSFPRSTHISILYFFCQMCSKRLLCAGD